MSATHHFEFDAAVAVSRAGDGWTGQVLDGWDIGGNANGGYVMALTANALRTASERAHPVTVTAHYLAPVTPGPVDIRTEVVKRGRRLTHLTGSAWRGGRQILAVLGAFGDLDDDAPQYLDGGPPDLPPPERCVVRTSDGGPVEVPLMDRLSIALHPEDAGIQTGEPTGQGVVRGWFAFADGRPVDTLALLLAADAFPPAVFNLGLPRGWVPTVELTVHVRAVPAPGPLACRFRTRFVSGGALEEDSEVWDTEGRLVALSRQYGLLARA
jgi:hypothetical protein